MAQRNPNGVSELPQVQRLPLNPALTELPHCLKDPLKPNLPNRPTTALKAVIPISNISAGTNTSSQPLVRCSPRKHTSTQQRSQPLHIAARTGPSNESIAKSLDFDSQQFTSQLDQFQGLVFEDRDRVTRLYSYLSLKTVKEIHHIKRPWKLKVRNRTKEQLVARILIHVYISNRKGTSLSNLISTNSESADFGDWEEKSMKNLFTWEILPDFSVIIMQLSPAEQSVLTRSIARVIRPKSHRKKEKVEEEVAQQPNNFTLNEFARLVVLLRDDQSCQSALYKATGAELKREELDARVGRESFWSIIENRFNDSMVDSSENFRGHLDDIDSNMRPLAHRSPTSLKNHFYQTKKLFTKVFNKWIFTENPDMELVQVVSKLIEVEEGGHLQAEDDDGEDRVEVRKQGSKKRKSSNLPQSFDGISKRVDRFQDIMQAQVELQNGQTATTDKKLSQSEEDSKLLHDVLDSLDRCKRAREGNDEEVKDMARILLERKKQRFRKFLEQSGDLSDHHDPSHNSI